MKKSLFLVSFVFISFAACNKRDAPVINPVSKAGMLTSGTWKITAMVSDDDGNGSYETDYYSGLPSCIKDNFVTFKAGGVLETDEGPQKCDPTDPQIITAAWQLGQNEANLIIDSEEFVIDALTTTTLRIKTDETLYGTMITLTKR